jgi:hypothetical protein
MVAPQAAIAAARLGIRRDEALTFVRAVAGLIDCADTGWLGDI